MTRYAWITGPVGIGEALSAPDIANGHERALRLPLFWRAFAINGGLLVVAALLLVLTPVTISRPIALVEAVIIIAGLVVMLVANALLLHPLLAPLERLVRRMGTVDLLRPDERLAVAGAGEAAAIVESFNAMLDRLEEERRQSARRAQAAQEDERLRIARGLHDEVGQVLTGVLLQLARLAEAAPPAEREALAETQQAVRQALEEVRRIARELRPEMLEHLGLVSALNELGVRFAARSGLTVERRFAGELPPLSREAELALYRVAQEGLTNVARHSGATRVEMALDRDGAGGVVLRLRDDGRGLPERPAAGGGLRGMQERALLVGGALALRSAQGGGAEVELRVPADGGA